MAAQNLLIMNLLRIITPEEIADIATKHNGGKFLSLTDLVTERVERKIYRDFTRPESIDEIYEAHAHHAKEKDQAAKILPFNKKENLQSEKAEIEDAISNTGNSERVSLTTMAIQTSQLADQVWHEEEVVEESVAHKENENMSTFILIEKARLKKSQKVLKQKEIIDLYQKNSSIDVEQIKSLNSETAQATEAGVLVNKKQY
jgi:hypothetical protein